MKSVVGEGAQSCGGRANGTKMEGTNAVDGSGHRRPILYIGHKSTTSFFSQEQSLIVYAPTCGVQ